jgi:AcrR family transcriptional regulator
MRSDRAEWRRERTFTEDARRAQIVDCAIDILAERGFAQASLDRIAERAGISKGVISYYFAGKADLLGQVVRSVYSAGEAVIRPRVEAEESAPAMLEAYLRANIEFLRDHHRQIAAMTEIILNARSAEGLLRFAGGHEGIEALLNPLEEILRKGQRDGDFTTFDTRTMAWTLRSAIDSVNQQRDHDPGLDFDRCSRELTALFARATTAHPTSAGPARRRRPAASAQPPDRSTRKDKEEGNAMNTLTGDGRGAGSGSTARRR